MIQKRDDSCFWFFMAMSAVVHGMALYALAGLLVEPFESKPEPSSIQVELKSLDSAAGALSLMKPGILEGSPLPAATSPLRFKSLERTKLPSRAKPMKTESLESRVSSAPALKSVLLDASLLEKSIPQTPAKSLEGGALAGVGGATAGIAGALTTGVAGGDGGGLSGRAGSGGNAIMTGYLARVRKMIKDKRRYPLVSRRALQEGTAKVRFCILKAGALDGKPELLASSGYSALDRAALDCVQDASPFPPIPSELRTQDLELNLSIIFQLKE
jgi:protein TonB